MGSPALVAVDDDPAALDDLERELRNRYGSDYQVLCTPSPERALEHLELFERVGELHPHAKRGLLVPWRAWGDHSTAEAINDSMALGLIDYYVLKPAAPPDEVFHQAVSSFLLEWTKARKIAPHTIHVVGQAWSGRAYELRNTLQRCAIPHAFCLADSSEGRELLAKAGPDPELPFMVFPDGRVLINPTNRELAQASGASIDPDHDEFDVVIIGCGPAGLSAAVYGASEGLHTLVVDEGGIGGQATSSSLIRNYLGFPKGLSGSRLAEQAYEQAWVFGSDFAFMHTATGLSRAGDRVVVHLSDDQRVSARAVILATGAAYRRLGVPSLEALNGAGVFYGGSASEAHALIEKEAFVVGGANSAGQAALHLERYAHRVTLVVRASSLGARMSHYLVQEIEATPNIEVRTATEVVGGGGEGHLQHLVLRANGSEETVAADGLFVLIGARPHTDWLPADVARDERGFLLTGADLPSWPLDRPPLLFETNMPGVFAAGDVRHASVKRVASAVGEGSIAIQLVHRLFAARLRPEPPVSAAGSGDGTR